MQLYLPIPVRSSASDFLKEMTHTVFGAGEAKNLVTDRDNIGIYVARIVADPRTLNQAVLVWEDEVSQKEAHEMGEELSGEGDVLKARRIYVSAPYVRRFGSTMRGRGRVSEY